MTPAQWQKVRPILESALELKPESRPAYVDSACSGDDGLRREVLSLLEDEKQSDHFLEEPAFELVRNVVAQLSLPPGTKLGEYELESVLGAGGMGEVYRARDPRLKRDVAIKILPSLVSADPDRLHRFKKEAQAAAALSHPHICTVYDIGDYHGQPFFVMELLEGQSLAERISGKPIPISELVVLAVQVCDAMRAAHDKGIIHRDIKPANIFLSANRQIKILDFGLAKLVEERRSALTAASMSEAETITGSLPATGCGLMGTPAYLSPEQARGEEVDARTDVFSFGLVLYEMATRQRAFRGQTTGDLINAILYESPVKPSTLNPDVSANLEAIILRALEKAPSARYQSASELLHDLDEFQKAQQHRKAWTTWAAVAAATLLLSTAIVVGILLSKSSVNEAPDIIQRQVTSNPVNDSVYMAAISADGKQLAYTDLRGVHVRALDTGEVHEVSIPPGLCFR